MLYNLNNIYEMIIIINHFFWGGGVFVCFWVCLGFFFLILIVKESLSGKRTHQYVMLCPFPSKLKRAYFIPRILSKLLHAYFIARKTKTSILYSETTTFLETKQEK